VRIRNAVKNLKTSTLVNIAMACVVLAVAILIVLLVNKSMREQALVEAEAKARVFLDHNLATHTYFTRQLKPTLFE